MPNQDSRRPADGDEPDRAAEFERTRRERLEDEKASRRITVRLEIIEGEYDPTDPIDRIAPRGAKVAILQTLQDAFRADSWHVWGGDADRIFHGYGLTRYEAILDWLRNRMGYGHADA